MRISFIPLAAAAMLLGLLVAPGQAAPLGAADAGVALADTTLVQRTHGWHRYCALGPARFHRHVPGIGNVPCRRYYRPYYYYGGAYIGPRYYRRWRRPFIGRHYVRPRLYRRLGGGEFRRFRGGSFRGFRGGFRTRR